MASTSSGAPDTRGWSLEDFERYDTLGMFCRCVRARACWPARTRYQQSSRRWRAFVSCTGTGTFGRVYLVQHKPTGKYYAMKILRKKVIVRLKQVQHIQNEKDVLQSINHPFIVNMYVTRDHARALSISLDLSLSLSLSLSRSLPHTQRMHTGIGIRKTHATSISCSSSSSVARSFRICVPLADLLAI